MRAIVASARLYFWILIPLNVVTVSLLIHADLWRAFYFALAANCLASYGFLLNDLCDRDLDRANNTGFFAQVSRSVLFLGGLVSGLLLLVAVCLGIWLGPSEVLVVSLITIGLTFYSLFGSRILLIANTLAAILAVSPLWAPLVLWAREIPSGLYLYVMAAFLLILGREIYMDQRDWYGDLHVGRRMTFATLAPRTRVAPWTAFQVSSGGCVFLVSAVFSLAWHHPWYCQFVVTVITIGVIALVMKSGWHAVWVGGGNDSEAIRRYVSWSRYATALVPLLNLTLWLGSE